MKRSARVRFALILPVLLCAILAGGATQVVQDHCGPFGDVPPTLCPFVLELYYLGVTAGTSAETFSPDDPLTRGHGAIFIGKALNQALARGTRRAALGQWWTTTPAFNLGITFVSLPIEVRSDGADLWVSSDRTDSVTRVRASDGRVLETWSVDRARAVLPAMGRIFVSNFRDPGALSMIDPSQPPGAPTTVAALPDFPGSLAFDGTRIWSGNRSSVSIITPGPALPWTVVTVSTGFTIIEHMIFDGSNIWVSDGAGTLLRLDANGAVLQTVTVGPDPRLLAFDGTNVWVPLQTSNSVAVVRASTGEVVTTLTGNGLSSPNVAGFDGTRVLVTGFGNQLSFWNAADLRPLGFAQTAGLNPYSVCSDGVSFWVTMADSDGLARY